MMDSKLHEECTPVVKKEEKDDNLFKGDQSRYVDHDFGNLKSLNLSVGGSLSLSSIAMGSPVDGGTVTIPRTAAVVILQSVSPYTLLTLVLPKQPDYGQTLSMVSTVDVANVKFSGGTFGTKTPLSMTASSPLRFIFAGTWFAI